eukprot:4059444-Lingulodinium_polyedra.AAC.1
MVAPLVERLAAELAVARLRCWHGPSANAAKRQRRRKWARNSTSHQGSRSGAALATKPRAPSGPPALRQLRRSSPVR